MRGHIKRSTGVIVAVRGSVAEVRFSERRPALHEAVLVKEGDTGTTTLLEVVASLSSHTFFCFILTPNHALGRGMQAEATGEPVQIPVGPSLLGRAFDILGNSHDSEGPLRPDAHRPLFTPRQRKIVDVQTSDDVIETGIKAIDFFTPILKSGKTALVGGAGVGKTVVLTAIMRRLMIKKQQQDVVGVFGAVGERSREAQELYEELKSSGALPYVSLLLGQMGENPALRFRTAYAAAAQAEYLRDETAKEVLYFMDNIYRFAQAGHELSILMGDIPSEDGYQPNLPSQAADLAERLISTQRGAVTSFWTVYVPSDDLTDYGVQSVFPYLDSIIILSREVVQAGRYPAIDLLQSISSALNPLTIGSDHYSAYLEARKILERAHTLERIVSLVGESELSEENQKIYSRARLIESYVTQDLFVGSTLTDDTDIFVPREETVEVMHLIVSGELDGFDPNDLLYTSGIEDIKQKLVERHQGQSVAQAQSAQQTS